MLWLAVPITLAPQASAIWTAKLPTPPAAAWISTESPAATPRSLSAVAAVWPEANRVPGLGPRHPLRLDHDLMLPGDNVVGVRAEHRPAEHLFPHGEAFDLLADGVDDPGELVSQPLRELRRHPRVRCAAAEQAVERLHAGGPHPHPDLARRRLGRVELEDPQHLRATVLVEHDCSAHRHLLSYYTIV